jgi:transposase
VTGLEPLADADAERESVSMQEDDMSTRIIGIDLAVTAAHQAAILDPATKRFVVKQMAFRTLPDELDRLLQRARTGTDGEPELIVVLEATSMAWHPVGLYLAEHGAKVYRVNGRLTKDLRRVRTPHARSDRIDCQVLANLYNTYPDELDRLYIPSGTELALQRACRAFARRRTLLAASDNRLTAYDNWAWQGLTRLVPAHAIPWVRTEWYNPWDVVAAGVETVSAAWRQAPASKDDDGAWLPAWVARAQALTQLFGTPASMQYPALAATIREELAQQAQEEQKQRTLLTTVILPLYQQLYPACHLPSIYGIGQASAAIYMAFIHTIDRFANVECFRQWTGMTPAADQSGNAQTKGLPLTQAGPNIVKATLFLDANVARQWDPQLAAIYYNQMVHYGKHHTQATCAVASHLANRIYAVLKAQRPYVLRDLEGQPITATAARCLIQEHFHVPDEVRSRTSKRLRRRPQLAITQ